MHQCVQEEEFACQSKNPPPRGKLNCREIKWPLFDGGRREGGKVEMLKRGGGKKVLPQQKIFSDCNVGLIERRTGAQLSTEEGRIFLQLIL